MRSLRSILIQYAQCPFKKSRLRHRHIQKENRVKTKGEDGHLQAKKTGLKM